MAKRGPTPVGAVLGGWPCEDLHEVWTASPVNRVADAQLGVDRVEDVFSMARRVHPAIQYMRGARLPHRDVLPVRLPAILRSCQSILGVRIGCARQVMRHLPSARHLLGVNLRRPHQALISTQRCLPAATPFDVRQIDDVTRDSGRYRKTRRCRRFRLRRSRIEADQANHRRHDERFPLAKHAEETASYAPVPPCEDPALKAKDRVASFESGSRNWKHDSLVTYLRDARFRQILAQANHANVSFYPIDLIVSSRAGSFSARQSARCSSCPCRRPTLCTRRDRCMGSSRSRASCTCRPDRRTSCEHRETRRLAAP